MFGKGSGNVHPFESYVKFLVANGESPDTVVTTVQFDDNAEGMELQFSPARPVTDEEYALVQMAQAKPEAEQYTRITVAQLDGAKEARKKEAAPALPPKVQRSDEPDDDAPAEPVKRVSKKKEEPAPAPAPKADLASVIEAWGSDD